MRYEIHFHVENKNIIPFSPQYMISSWIYRILEKSDPEFSTFMHDEGLLYRNRRYKPFAFSNLMFETCKIAKGKGYEVSGHVKLIVASPLIQFSITFLKNIYTTPLELHTLKLTPIKVEIIPEPEYQTVMIYEPQSPVVVPFQKDDQLIYAHPLQQDFYEKLIQFSCNRYHAIYQFENNKEFPVSPSNVKIEVHNPEKFNFKKAEKLVRYRNKNIKGFEVPLKISAPILFHKFAYETSIGSYCNQGFGMYELTIEQGGEKF